MRLVGEPGAGGTRPAGPRGRYGADRDRSLPRGPQSGHRLVGRTHPLPDADPDLADHRRVLHPLLRQGDRRGGAGPDHRVRPPERGAQLAGLDRPHEVADTEPVHDALIRWPETSCSSPSTSGEGTACPPWATLWCRLRRWTHWPRRAPSSPTTGPTPRRAGRRGHVSIQAPTSTTTGRSTTARRWMPGSPT